MSSLRTVQLNKKTRVSIVPAAPNIDLDSDLYAINWFDLRRPWLYDLYNKLAFPHVKKVGGQVHFKGLVKEKIKGPKEFDREMLLIVKYPNAKGFLQMLQDKIFLMKSILRLNAVQYFTFGFCKRMDNGPAPLKFPKAFNGNRSYLLHHFQSNISASEYLYKIAPIIDNTSGIKLYFSGFKAALIGTERSGNKLKTQPFIMDGLILIEGEDDAQLTNFTHNEDFKQLATDLNSFNNYIFERIV
ncbi:MAG: hypothetical protein RJQ09_15480 [Cyclobacteriaceae bacterium]